MSGKMIKSNYILIRNREARELANQQTNKLVNWKAIICCSVFVIIMCTSSNAAGYDYMQDLGSPRVMALGGSGVAGVADMYVAPAALVQDNKKILSSAYEQTLGEITKYTLCYTTPVDSDTHLGFGLTMAQLADIPVTEWDDNHRPKTTDTFSDEKLGGMFAYSRKLSADLSLGCDLKYYQHRLYTEKAQGIGFDLGMIWNITGPVSLGFMLHNVGDTKLKWTTGTVDTIAQEFITGGAYRFTLLGLRSQFLADVVWGYTVPKVYSGMEVWLSDMFALRLGSRAGTITAGLGLYIEGFALDYAYDRGQAELGDGQKIMIGYVF